MDRATVDKLLTTTRSVRKRLDLGRPVERSVIEECLALAIQAPTGSNAQGWRFLVVTDPEPKRVLQSLYARAFFPYLEQQAEQPPRFPEGDPRAAQMERIRDSAVFLAEHLHEVPVLIIPCVEGRVEDAPAFAQASLYGSILPAAWSLMLALRSRGLGSAWTTLHLPFEKAARDLLGIPESVTQAALLPVAYYTGGGFKPARRIPAERVTYWNRWGAH